MKKLVLLSFVVSFFTLSQANATLQLMWDERNQDATSTKVFAGGQMLENLSADHPVTTSTLLKDDIDFIPTFHDGKGNKKGVMIAATGTFKVLFKGNKDNFDVVITKVEDKEHSAQ